MKCYRFIVFFGLFIAFFAPVSSVHAQTWAHRASKLNFIQTYLPDDVKETYKQLRIAPNAVATAGRIERSFDQRPYKNYNKEYVIEYEQSLGGSLNTADGLALADIALKNFIQTYEDKNARILRQDVGWQGERQYVGSEAVLVYDDPELGEQQVRGQFLFTGQMKVFQRVSGDEKALAHADTYAFFNNIKLIEGYFESKGLLSVDWKRIDSPLDIYTVYLPKVQEPYVPITYKVERKGNAERVNALFHDPVLDEDIFYTLYAYKIDQNFNAGRVAQALRQKHITPKKRGDDKDIVFKNLKVDDADVVETEFAIKFDKTDQKGVLRLKAFYKDNYLLVHEIIGTPRTVRSSFIDNIIDSTIFYPGLVFDDIEAGVPVKSLSGADAELPALKNIGG